MIVRVSRGEIQGDAARVRAARERAELTLNRVRTDQRLSAVRLAEILRLDPAVDLAPPDGDLAPISVMSASDDLATLVTRALASRADLDEAAARI